MKRSQFFVYACFLLVLVLFAGCSATASKDTLSTDTSSATEGITEND
jgi:outer membrane murein-binding lipoprotein Lpp